MYENRTYFTGNAGRDAQLISANSKGVTFNLADTVKGKDGRPDETTWLKCVVFGPEWLAENALRQIKKGCRVVVVGNLRDKTFTTKDGVEKTEKSCYVNTFGLIQKDDTRFPVPESTHRPTVDFSDDIGDVPF